MYHNATIDQVATFDSFTQLKVQPGATDAIIWESPDFPWIQSRSSRSLAGPPGP